MPVGVYPRKSAEERFWLKVNKTATCWLWTAYIDKDGYGQFAPAHHQPWRAHCYSWALTRGPIPDGMWVLHHCDNPSCVRPDHLFLGSAKDNADDRVRKGRGAFGERNGFARLTDEKVRAIRNAEGFQHVIGEQFGVSQTTVWRVKRGIYWNHVS